MNEKKHGSKLTFLHMKYSSSHSHFAFGSVAVVVRVGLTFT